MVPDRLLDPREPGQGIALQGEALILTDLDIQVAHGHDDRGGVVVVVAAVAQEFVDVVDHPPFHDRGAQARDDREGEVLARHSGLERGLDPRVVDRAPARVELPHEARAHRRGEEPHRPPGEEEAREERAPDPEVGGALLALFLASFTVHDLHEILDELVHVPHDCSERVRVREDPAHPDGAGDGLVPRVVDREDVVDHIRWGCGAGLDLGLEGHANRVNFVVGPDQAGLELGGVDHLCLRWGVFLTLPSERILVPPGAGVF